MAKCRSGGMRRRRAWLRDESGQATAMWAVLVLAMLALGGLVYDGGQILTARRDASNAARQAARAGAQELSEQSLRAGGAVLDPVAADRAVREYLARQEMAPDSVVVTGTTVTVTVTVTRPALLLGIVGIESRTVSSTGSARSVRGVTEADN